MNLLTAKVRVFIDFLVEQLGDTSAWGGDCVFRFMVEVNGGGMASLYARSSLAILVIGRLQLQDVHDQTDPGVRCLVIWDQRRHGDTVA